MKQLSENDAALVVKFMLEVRIAYYRRHGASMKIYDLLKTRMASACRCTSNMKAWCTYIIRNFDLNVSAGMAKSILDLVTVGCIEGTRSERRMIRLIEQELGWVVSLIRLAVEEGRERKLESSEMPESDDTHIVTVKRSRRPAPRKSSENDDQQTLI